MALVRAICRSNLTDLTVVSYGGPDVGLLCATGKASRVVCPFVTLDSIPLDPHWRQARQEGRVTLTELDEGMFFLGLQAAAWRVPFLPSRAGLGSDVLRVNPDLRTVRSPYADGPFADPDDAEDGGAEFVAAPALRLDVAVIHANRADTAGNAQLLSPDPFFDDLFLGAARRRFVTAEQVVPNGELTEHGPIAAVKVHRLLTDGVAETPGGAHFTACPPDYGRDEAFQKEYVASAKEPEAWDAFRSRYLEVDEARYRQAVEERGREGAAS
jgi:glutaconate CoA-transferase subunit A